MKNKIYIVRKQKVILPVPIQSHTPRKRLVATLLDNLGHLGYTVTPPLLNRLLTTSPERLIQFYEDAVLTLKEMRGAHVEFRPMYPNFPEQVMSASSAELYFNAMLHYLMRYGYDVAILPFYEKEERVPLETSSSFKDKTHSFIDLGTEEEFQTIFHNLMRAKSSLSQSDKEDVQQMVGMYKDEIEMHLPDVIPHKENMAVVMAAVLSHVPDAADIVPRYVKTATDVLRIASALSDGDVSLAQNTQFRSFKRAERRLLLGLLEQCGAITEDMRRQKKRWIRLGERLHPFEYREKFPKTAKAFDIIRNNKPFTTFNNQVERALLNNHVEAVSLLATRPGEMARRLDHLLRTADDVDNAWTVLERFEQVIGGVSTPVLLQLYKHFKHRNDPRAWRIIFPKGMAQKVKALPNKLPPIPHEVCASVTELCEAEMVRRFAERPSLGTCYIDPALQKQIIPFSQRSASKALRPIARGSRFTLPADKETVRFFLWWKDGEKTGHVDIDLSAVIYGEAWEFMERIAYTNLRSEKYKAYHSGDITAAPDGACEFIDFDIPSILEHGGRYIVASILSYSHQPFADLPECFGGWMMRTRPQSGEIFEPKTVVNKVDLTARTRICIPVILDLKEREAIWTDIALTKNPMWNNVENNMRGITLMGMAMRSLIKPTLHELFTMHAKARGEQIDDREAADTIFSLHEGITPFDVDVILSNYL